MSGNYVSDFFFFGLQHYSISVFRLLFFFFPTIQMLTRVKYSQKRTFEGVQGGAVLAYIYHTFLFLLFIFFCAHSTRSLYRIFLNTLPSCKKTFTLAYYSNILGSRNIECWFLVRFFFFCRKRNRRILGFLFLFHFFYSASYKSKNGKKITIFYFHIFDANRCVW